MSDTATVTLDPLPPFAEGLNRPATTVPGANRGEPARPRRPRAVSSVGVFNTVGAVVAALCLTALVFGPLVPLSGLIGFVVVAYGLFLVLYGLLVYLGDDVLAARDRVATVLLCTAAVIAGLALAFVLAYTFWGGRQVLFRLNFYTQDMRKAGPRQGLEVGGIKHAMIGTLWMISIAMAITVPLGLTTAVFMNEVRGRLSRFVRTIVEAMTALPSIIAGLFIYATYVLFFHTHNGLAAALALSVDMLPIITRAADVVLRLVPGNLREASLALGAPQWRTVRDVVLPTARSGLATAVILGMARGLGETAPVLLTAGYTTFTNTNPTKGPMVSLPLAAYDLVKSGEKNLQARGFGAAAALLLLVLLLFTLARIIGGRGPGQLSKRQRERNRRRSIRDANRIIERYERRTVSHANRGNGGP
jgi:phosphate transport system permease protein